MQKEEYFKRINKWLYKTMIDGNLKCLLVIAEDRKVTGGNMEKLKSEVTAFCRKVEEQTEKDVSLLGEFNKLNKKLVSTFENNLICSNDSRFDVIDRFNETGSMLFDACRKLVELHGIKFMPDDEKWESVIAEDGKSRYCKYCMKKEGIFVLKYSEECPVCSQRNNPQKFRQISNGCGYFSCSLF